MKSKTLSILLIVCAIALYTIAVIDVTIGNWFGAVPNFLQACVAVAVVYLLYKLNSVREVTILTTKRLADLFLMLSKGVKAELHIVNGDEDEDKGDEIPEEELTEDEKRIKRMAEEYDQLADRLHRLQAFRDTYAYKQLPENSRYLLDKQCKAMDDYESTLKQRIQLECDTANKKD